MGDDQGRFSDAATKLVAGAREAAREAIDAAFVAGRPVHEAGMGDDAESTYRVWPDGRRERLESSKEQAQRLRSARTA
jgi:hypothetical protein